jgi:hypothetical protein|tara:strand:+ start:321 stop:422 length:102 start_codon:yes stop_codon:yes gene_type:complete
MLQSNTPDQVTLMAIGFGGKMLNVKGGKNDDVV